MATVEVRKAGGGKAGSVELDPAVFEAQVRPHLFHAEVRRQLSARRAGTHGTRNRAGVSGGGAKPYRQKGTGRARQGTTRAPQYAGGGVVFGPVPRGYEHSLNKKARREALRSALSLRLGEEALVVIDALSLEVPKTRALVEALAGAGVEQSALVVVGEPDSTLALAARNLPSTDVIPAAGLNVYDILRHDRLVFTREGLDAVHARFGGAAKEGEA